MIHRRYSSREPEVSPSEALSHGIRETDQNRGSLIFLSARPMFYAAWAIGWL